MEESIIESGACGRISDEEFMALYEQLPAFEDFDDEFVTNEEQWTNQVAEYVDNHLTDFIKIS